jgi:hypothetical protein
MNLTRPVSGAFRDPEPGLDPVDDWLTFPLAAPKPQPGSMSLRQRRARAFVKALLAEVRSDAWFYVSVAAYIGAAYLLASTFQAEGRVRPFLYVTSWTVQTAFFGFIALLAASIVSGVLRKPRSPVSGACEAFAQALSPRFVAGLLMLAVLPIFYGTFTSIKNMLPSIAEFAWDPWLADVDRALHGGFDPGLVLRHLFGTELTLAVDYVYSVLWFFLLIGVAAWAACSRDCAHLRTRFFLTLVLAWILIGNLLAGIFLSAGPCFYAEVTGDSVRFAELVDLMLGRSAQYKSYLWELYADGGINLATGISAFPSMHLAIATLIALYLSSVSRFLGALGIVFVVVVQCGSVVLGWHYAIDGYVSIAITLALWKLSALVGTAKPFSRNVPAAPSSGLREQHAESAAA